MIDNGGRNRGNTVELVSFLETIFVIKGMTFGSLLAPILDLTVAYGTLSTAKVLGGRRHQTAIRALKSGI